MVLEDSIKTYEDEMQDGNVNINLVFSCNFFIEQTIKGGVGGMGGSY